MTNYVQKGNVLTLAAPYDRLSGEACLVGTIFGVATVDVLSGVDAEFMLEGVIDITKIAGVTLSQGDRAYWDDSQKAVVATDSGNSYLIGVATEDAASGDATARVRLNGVATAT